MAIVDGTQGGVENALGGRDGTIDELFRVGEGGAVGEGEDAEGGGGSADHGGEDFGVGEEVGGGFLGGHAGEVDCCCCCCCCCCE